jgi:hypothetical protein
MKSYTGNYLSLLPVKYDISNMFSEKLSPLCAEALLIPLLLYFFISEFLEGHPFMVVVIQYYLWSQIPVA